MKMRASLLGLFLLVALLAAACGPATTIPEALDDGQPSSGQDGTEAMLEEDDLDSLMAEESEAEIEKDDSESLTVENSEAAMEEADSEGTMDEDSEATMEEDADGTVTEGAGAMKEQDDLESAVKVEAEEEMIDLPAWFGAELTDVNSGEVLAVADLQGKVILVETMAIWCSNCLRQQKEVKALHEALGMRDDLVTLVLDIDPNEDADNLRAYADKHGFSWTYVVAPRDVAREIGQLYGNQFLNPPSTPMLIIDQHGEVHLLPFGRKTAQDLQEALEPFLAAGL